MERSRRRADGRAAGQCPHRRHVPALAGDRLAQRHAQRRRGGRGGHAAARRGRPRRRAERWSGRDPGGAAAAGGRLERGAGRRRRAVARRTHRPVAGTRPVGCLLDALLPNIQDPIAWWRRGSAAQCMRRPSLEEGLDAEQPRDAGRRCPPAGRAAGRCRPPDSPGSRLCGGQPAARHTGGRAGQAGPAGTGRGRRAPAGPLVLATGDGQAPTGRRRAAFGGRSAAVWVPGTVSRDAGLGQGPEPGRPGTGEPADTWPVPGRLDPPRLVARRGRAPPALRPRRTAARGRPDAAAGAGAGYPPPW